MNKFGRLGFLVVSFSGLGMDLPLRAETPLEHVDRHRWCVTSGAISDGSSGLLSIESASSRAIVLGVIAKVVELRFRYLGPSAHPHLLASGELRRQIGLKLRAPNSCNVLYAMWRIAPKAGLVVSLKRNPGLETHSQCGARGYAVQHPTTVWTLPDLVEGEWHTLRAELQGRDLALTVDAQRVWFGTLGPEIEDLNGPVGLRSDNGRFEFSYSVGQANSDGAGVQSQKTIACTKSRED
jgi:hypothetical protein